MGKTALFFPGQASQYVGMGKDLYEYSSRVRSLYEYASDQIGEDIARLSFEGPSEELKRTRYTQPAILLHSLAVLTVLEDGIPAFDYACGHSLGEYGALAVTGALTYEDAIRAVVRRAELMEEACTMNAGTMAAVLGLGVEEIGRVCDKASSRGVVIPANFNSRVQTAVSGSVVAVEEAIVLAREAGAKRALKLEVGGAFHSPLMEPARAGLESFLRDVRISPPSRPVIANVTGGPVTEVEVIRRLLVEQLTSPVKWLQSMDYLVSDGVTSLIEIGPGRVLSGLAKRDMRPESMINLDTLEDVTRYKAAVV